MSTRFDQIVADLVKTLTTGLPTWVRVLGAMLGFIGLFIVGTGLNSALNRIVLAYAVLIEQRAVVAEQRIDMATARFSEQVTMMDNAMREMQQRVGYIERCAVCGSHKPSGSPQGTSFSGR